MVERYERKLQRDYEERLNNSAYSRAAASGYSVSHCGRASFAKSSAAKTLFSGIVSLVSSAISAYAKIHYGGRD